MSVSSDRQDTGAKIIDVEDKIEQAEPIEMPAPAVHPARKQVCILGTTPSRMEGPIEDKDWEIWTIGPGGKDLHRWDRLFEIHGVLWPLNFGELNNGKSYLDDLSKVEPPQSVYSIVPMQWAMGEWARKHEKDDDWLKANITGDWKGNVVINREALYQRHGRMWFTSSISYALALALEEEYTNVAIFGIDLESGEEYIAQYPGARHFIDMARVAYNTNIIMPEGCGLLRDPLPYPDRYETHMSLSLQRKVEWLEALLGENLNQAEDSRMMLFRVEGALLKIRQMNEMLQAGTVLTQEFLQEQIKAGEAELLQYNRQAEQLRTTVDHIRGELSALRFSQRMWVFGTVDPNFELTVAPPK